MIAFSIFCSTYGLALNPAIETDLDLPQRQRLTLKTAKNEPISRQPPMGGCRVEPLFPQGGGNRGLVRLTAGDVGDPPFRCRRIEIFCFHQNMIAVRRPEGCVRILDRGEHISRRTTLKCPPIHFESGSVKQSLPIG